MNTAPKKAWWTMAAAMEAFFGIFKKMDTMA
jgi:hypothetical protein